ncbi:MAG: MATE family efflux transporter [Terrimicrobiaceae bacterium]
MLVGQAGQVLLQMTDMLMVGRLGPVPLAAAALAGNFVMFSMYFAYGSLGAVSPRIAQAFGSGDSDRAAAAARAGILLAVFVSVIVVFALSLVVPFLGHLGQPREVVDLTGGYLILLAWSMPGALIALVLGQTAEAVSQPWPVVGFMGGALVLNATLNYLLVFGHAGFPALGLEGAGWATLVARWSQAIAMALWISRAKTMRVFRIFSRRIEVPLFRQLFRDGLPVAGQDVLEGGSFAVGSLMMGWVGTTALAANQVAISIASLAWMFPISLSMATGVRVAQAVGAGNLKAARRAGIAGILLGTGLMACCAVVYICGGRWLAGFFTSDHDVATLAGVLVTIAGIYQISDAIQSISLGALRGLVDNRVPLVANAACYWLLSLPTVYFLTFPAGLGAAGIWLGYLPWMALTGLFFLWRFLRKTSKIEQAG